MCNISISSELYLEVDTRIDEFLTHGSCEWLDHPNHLHRQPDDCLYSATAPQSSTIVKLAKFSRLVRMMNQLPPIMHCSPWPGYNRGLDRIVMPHNKRFSIPELYYSILFHEAVHSTGHPSRLNRSELMG